MQQSLRQLLRLLDLSEEETELYLCMLENSSNRISEILKKKRIPKTSVYRMTRRLVERNLLKEKSVNGKQREYIPCTIAELLERATAQGRELETIKHALRNTDSLLPFMRNEEGEASVALREGMEDFRQEYLSVPTTLTQEYLHMGSVPDFWKTANMGFESPEERWFISTRLRRNVYARILELPSPEAHVVQAQDSREKRTTKIIPSLPLKKDFVLVSDTRVSHFVCNPDYPRVIVIRHPSAVQMYRQHFDLLWEKSAA